MATLTGIGKGVVETQLIVNGDNEAAIATLTGGTAGEASCTSSRSDTKAHAGTYSTKLTSLSGGTPWFYRSLHATSGTPGSFSRGARYVISGWVYIPSLAEVPDQTIIQAGLQLSLGTGAVLALYTSVKGTWTFVQGERIAALVETGSWYFRLAVNASSGTISNVVYFDDISIYEYKGGGIAVPKPTLSGSGARGRKGTLSTPLFTSIEVSGGGVRVGTGVVAAILPSIGASSGAGIQKRTGVVAAALPSIGAELTGKRTGVGVVAAELPSIGAELEGLSLRQIGALAEEEDGEMETVKAGTTSLILMVEMRNTVGQPLTGLTHEGVTALYTRDGSAAAPSTVALSAGELGTWSSGGWVEVDPVNFPGLYQFGVPNAAIAAGARGVRLRFTATGAWPRTVGVQLVSYNPADGVRLGLTALPNAAAAGEGGLPVRDASGEVAASVSGEVALTSAYDAAKTAATAASVTGVGAQVTALQADMDTLLDTDLPAVKSSADAAGASADAGCALIAGLNDVTAAEVVSAIRASVVDGDHTVADLWELMLAFIAGNVTVSGTDPRTFSYKKQDGATVIMTRTIGWAVPGRTVVL
jgi:hypothetical protein